ncbi:hypothetical protein, partial [Janthinobacterium sp. UMAB-56]|uniref:hypothetical protein n=1 Tax=Janthinobacterium sp. UMAB-56 TaxID=1365361 RepID=UPI001C5789D1
LFAVEKNPLQCQDAMMSSCCLEGVFFRLAHLSVSDLVIQNVLQLFQIETWTAGCGACTHGMAFALLGYSLKKPRRPA